jgi:hypothetical protein
MRAAVLAALAGKQVTADEHLSEASDAAARVREGIYHGTAFGPASVRIHKLSLAVDLGDIATALSTAEGWAPPQSVPAERRSHFFVDLARGQVLAGRPDLALASLDTARRIAPQHIRHSPEARATVARMLAEVPRPTGEMVNFARWTGAMPGATGQVEEDQVARPAS